MMILRLYENRVLMPVRPREWRSPSIAVPKDQLGNDTVRTMFRLTARLHDGHIIWQGWFEDRDDADAFLFALVSGSLRYERELWRLPVPEWHPGIGTDVLYAVDTVTTLTATGANTYSTPSDWNNAANTVQCLGGGASGCATWRQSSGFSYGFAGGGGGGGYGAYANLTISGSVNYTIGTGGTAVTQAATGTTVGNAGGDTFFNGASYAAASVGGTGGGVGQAVQSNSTTTASGGAGGTGKGTSSNSGGRGGNVSVSAASRFGTGGGGAAGPSGAGNNGTDNANNTSAGTAGGSGNAGSGGAGSSGASSSNPSNGSAGTEWTGSAGSGGGGGGAITNTSPSVTAGSGGNYGGGGGGVVCNAVSVTSGAGIQGLIVITYTPAASISLANINLAMIGM